MTYVNPGHAAAFLNQERIIEQIMLRPMTAAEVCVATGFDMTRVTITLEGLAAIGFVKFDEGRYMWHTWAAQEREAVLIGGPLEHLRDNREVEK